MSTIFTVCVCIVIGAAMAVAGSAEQSIDRLCVDNAPSARACLRL